jgi:hypothetical protein
VIDVELWLHDWLATEFGVRVVTELPANLQDVVPVIQVGRVGGGNRYTIDRPTVDVVCFTSSLSGGDGRNAARKFAELVRDAMYFRLPGTLPVTSVATVSAPAWRPYDNPAVRCYGATYQLTVASVPSA